MTLTEHLALRERERQEAEAREQERERRVRAIRALDAFGCTCPACQRLRQQQAEGLASQTGDGREGPPTSP